MKWDRRRFDAAGPTDQQTDRPREAGEWNHFVFHNDSRRTILSAAEATIKGRRRRIKSFELSVMVVDDGDDSGSGLE